MTSKLSIEKLCNENWENMKIGLQSRFCDHCQKDVMDFTAMDRKQILEYLLTNYNKQVCGRIKASQLDFSDNDFLITIEALNKQSKNTNLSFYLLALSSLILASCSDESSSHKRTAPTHLAVDTKSENQNNGDLQTITNKEKVDLTKNTPTPINDPSARPTDIVMMGAVIDSIAIDQTGDIRKISNEPYFVAEKMPEFIGGLDSLRSFVKKNLDYPEWERKNKIQGKVYVRLTIDKTGKVKDPTIKRTVGEAKNFDIEVLRIIEKMPNWIPGEQANQKVDVYFTIPIEFKLQ